MIAATCAHPPIPIAIVGPSAHATPRDMIRPYAVFKIEVDANGSITKTALEDSTGDKSLDDLSAQALRRWTFLPANENCKAVSGSAEYAVDVRQLPQRFDDPCEHDGTVGVQVTPEYPDSAVNVGIGKETTVGILISIDAAGRVTGMDTEQSSGYGDLDMAAKRAALLSTYLPAVHGCQPVASHYVFRVTFDPNR